MSTLRIIVLSVLLTFVLVTIGYYAVMPTYAVNAESTSEACASVNAYALSTEKLKDIINGRYEHRVGLPR